MRPTEKTEQSLAINFAEFRVGWRILILALIGIGTSVSVAPLYAFGSMMVPLQDAFGWTRGEIQPAISFLFGCSVVSIQITGWLFKRYGIRSVTICSLVTLPLAYLLITFNTGSIWQLYGGYMLLAFAGLGTMQVTWTQLVNLWFDVNRGLALAIILCGTGMAALTLPSLLSWSIGQWGWRAGYWVLGLLPLLITLPLSLFWLSSAAPLVQKVAVAEHADIQAVKLPGMSLRQAARSKRFWVCNLALVLAVTAMIGMVINTVPLLRDKGLSAADAASVFGIYGLSLVMGRVVVGYLIDRFWAPAVAFVVMMMPAIGSLIFMTQSDMHILMLGSILVGLGAGAEMDIAAFLMARYFGMRDYARVYSLHMGLIGLGSTIAPFGYGLLFARTGNYTAMLVYCVCAFALGSVLLLTLGRYPRFAMDDALVPKKNESIGSIHSAPGATQ
ncbi:MAG: putative major facilitator superfamily transporter [Pseudomonas sp.]|jgi:MFS family permease|uniref:MFS transporter n=1 Tax=Pseudomonas sp. TaxID=306 RepID=UPI0026180703|nr:MFS transporter [Pseudomonas sp.]MDB6052129.1 putative major facilitator superfamily transporter [Pseudomonas sp.]